MQEPIEIVVRNSRVRVPFEFCLPKATLILTAGPRSCLLVFKPEKWTPIRDKLFSYSMPEDPAKHAEINSLRRLLIGNARDVEVSARNMISLDEELACYAQIQGRLLWVSTSKAVELWSPSNFDPAKRLMLFSPDE